MLATIQTDGYALRMDITKEVADKVSAAILRNEKETISSVARKAFVPYSTLHRKLSGGGDFSMSELGRIADVLDIPPYTLLPSTFTQAGQDAA